MKRFLSKSAGWLIGVTSMVLRMTLRVKCHSDPRPALRRDGRPHVFALLHSQQLAAAFSADRGTAAIVSRSADGEFVVPLLRLAGMVPNRGSSGTSKGGATALQAMIEHVSGNKPAVLTVDGPRGPRGKVKQGIALLAKKSDAAVLPVMTVPSRRWIIKRTWDRLQIPKPFSTIHCWIDEPLIIRPGESLEQFAERIEIRLAEMERQFDAEEAAIQRQTAATGRPAFRSAA